MRRLEQDRQGEYGSSWGYTLGAIAVAGMLAAWQLGLDPRDLLLTDSKLIIAKSFFSRAFSPAFSYEASTTPDTAAPLIIKAIAAAYRTLLFAASAMSLAICGGLLLGYFCSSTWKNQFGRSSAQGRFSSAMSSAIYFVARLLSALMRSVHELLWAVLFLCAVGLSEFSAVLAIAIPYAGIMAKVFSELIDEAPTGPARALEGAGANSLKSLVFGIFPLALPDISAFMLYRFECALRSSAVLGFFGFQTLGYFIAASFENLHYGEVWTYLYVLFLLILIVDIWSSFLRSKIVY